MIKFGIMKVEGFASIQKLEIDWGGDNGVVLIQARNGSGKSRLINAFYWVLFGKSMYGSVETWGHVRPKDYKGTKVELSITIDEKEYTIIRCLNYTGKVNGFSGKNRFIVTEDGVEWDIKDKRDIQLRWISVLKYTPELFMNSVVFGQKQKRLMDNKGSEKKELFDEAFDTFILNKAYQATTDSVKEQLLNLGTLTKDLDAYKGRLKVYEREKEREQEREANFYKEIESQINGMKKERQELKKNRRPVDGEIKEINTRLTRVDENIAKCNHSIRKFGMYAKEVISKDISDTILTYQKELFSLNKDINNLNQDIGRVQKKTVCPTCGKPYTKEEISLTLASLHNELKANEDRVKTITISLSKAQDELRKTEKTEQALSEFKEDLNSAKNEKFKLETTLKGLLDKQKEYERVNDQMKFISEKIARIRERRYAGHNYDKDIEYTQRMIKETKKEIIKCKVVLKRLKFSQELFSNKGIKSWLFSFLLEKVNDMLSNYAQVSGFEINFWVDLESTKGDIYTLIKRHGEEVPYEDLSGGQQQLVNLLSIFAVMDVIQEKRPCPLFIGDELFESLDPQNIQMVGNIIRQKSQNKKMFIVSHLEDFILENAQIIKLENVQGQTVLS